MKKISVIIPNYNGIKYIKTCMDSLSNQTMKDFGIIFVDNGSTDGSKELVERNYPQVQVIGLTENTGFCGAVNAGIRKADTEFVVLLNNDTEVDADFLKELYLGIERHPKAFSAQAKMIQFQNRSQIDDAGNYYNALGWAFACGKGKSAENYTQERKIFASCAGAAIYRTVEVKKLGFFDEEHFAYLEDLDLGYRAQIAGYENWFLPKAIVYHIGSGTSGSRYNQFKVRYSSRNNLYMIYKNMPFLQLLLNSPFLLMGFGVKFLFFTCKGYGREYAAGIKNGVSLWKRKKKVPYKKGQWKQYFRIQLQLWRNIIRCLK